MFEFQLLAADWWNWLIPAVFIVIYLLNHLLAGKVDAPNKREAQRRRAAGPGERALGPAAGKQQGGQAQLNAEIDQFLKRANERRMEKARRQATPAAGGAKAAVVPAAALREQPLDVEPIDHGDFDAVEESVRKHFGSRGFAERADRLADDIEQADEEMEQHLKLVFDHRLGSLDRRVSDDPNAPRDVKSPIPRADPLASAKALAGLLTNQENLRQAILLKEILERPVDRW